MNILCFLSGSYVSGKEFVGLDVIRDWKNQGHNVHVAYMGWHDGKMQQMLNEMKVPNYPIKLGWYYLSKPVWSLDSLVHYPSAIRQFLKVQKNVDPDVIYVDSYRQVLLLKPFLKNNVLFHVHDPHSHSNIEKRILRIADKRVAKYIAVSSYIKQDLSDSGIQANKIVVIHNGATVPANFEKQYMLNGKLRIGIVGQVLSRKGHEDIIEACGSLKGTVPFELYIYGTGDNEFIQSLKDIIEKTGLTNNVIWKGFEIDKGKVYDSVDVVVAATRNDEPFALVALESGAHKVPIIATKSGGFPECIIDGCTGYIVPKQDSRTIAEKLKELYTQNMLLQNMGNAAYKHIKEKFSIDFMHQKMRKVLTEINA